MSEFIKHYNLKFTPLSPVHIGTGDSYEPANYVIDTENDALYSFDSFAAQTGLSQPERKQLLNIVNAKPDDRLLTNVQAFFHQHREKMLPFACAPIPTAPGVRKLYEKRIGKIAQQERRGKRIINKLEIERSFYNPVTQAPLLPGSSLKGAIRTALLDSINQKAQLLRGERNRELQKRLFQGQFHSDPMRLISIADASWQGDDDNPAHMVQFAVNRKRNQSTKDGKTIKSTAENKGLYQLLECLAPCHIRSFSGSISLQNVKPVQQFTDKLPKPEYQWSIQDIARYCNAFYMHLFWQETQAMQKNNYLHSQWLEQIKQLFSGNMLKRMNNGEAFLLRAGRHSGAEALTLEGVRQIKIMQGKKPPRYQTQPTTWWLAAERESAQTELLPFGWLLVEINPTEDDPQLQQWHDGQQNKHDWFKAQLAKQQLLKQDILQRQQQESARLQAQKEAEAREKQRQLEEQQRLASLSPIEREIEELLGKTPEAEHDTRLLKELESGRWDSNDAKIVAQKVKQLMEEAGKWMPDFAGTNKKKLKLKQRSEKVLQYLQ